MHTKFVVFAFFVCGTYTYEKCKIYKLLIILTDRNENALDPTACLDANG